MSTKCTDLPNPVCGNILTCFTSAAATYLAHHAIDYTFAFGLQLYIAIHIEEQDGLKGSFLYLHQPLTAPLLSCTLPLVHCWTEHPLEAQQLLLEECMTREQVIIVGDTYALPWHINYGKVHAVHWFVVAAMDKQQGKIYINDPFEFIDVHGTQAAYEGWLPLSQLAKMAKTDPTPSHSYRARNQHGLGGTEPLPLEAYQGYQWLAAAEEVKQWPVTQENLQQALLQTYNAMSRGTQRPDLTRHQWIVGLEAVNALPGLFETYLNTPDLYEMRDDFWGIARHHQLFAHALRSTAQVTGQSHLAELAAWCDDIVVPQWLAIPRLMLYNQTRLLHHQAPKEVLIQHAKEIYRTEQMLLEKLAEIVFSDWRSSSSDAAHQDLKREPMVRTGEKADAHTPQEIQEDAGITCSPVEELVSQVWQEILARKTIGLSEDFFNIGGDSLKATQIVSRLSLLFQTEISLLTFLDKPTIAELAAEIEDLLLADDDF